MRVCEERGREEGATHPCVDDFGREGCDGDVGVDHHLQHVLGEHLHDIGNKREGGGVRGCERKGGGSIRPWRTPGMTSITFITEGWGRWNERGGGVTREGGGGVRGCERGG